MINSTVQSEAYSADSGVVIYGCCANVTLTNTSMRFANIHSKGVVLLCTGGIIKTRIQMDNCQFIGSSGVPSIIYLSQVQANIINCIFFNNTSDANSRSVINRLHHDYQQCCCTEATHHFGDSNVSWQEQCEHQDLYHYSFLLLLLNHMLISSPGMFE